MKNLILLIALIIAASRINAAEKKEIIAVIDTGASFSQITDGILCNKGRISYVGDSGIDRNGHGRNIIGIIAKKMNTEKQCILSYKVWEKGINGKKATSNIVRAILHATARGAKYINISMGGPLFDNAEFAAIKRANRLGIHVIVASGNEGKDFNKVKCDYYPACYRTKYQSTKFRVVTTKSLKSSNRGDIVTNIERGSKVKAGGKTLSGTSQAAAVLTSKLINK